MTIVATVAAWALVNKYWTWPNALVGSVLLLSGTLYLMDRLGVGPSTRSRVRNWLDGSGFGIQTIQDEKEFHFAMIDNVGLRTNIWQIRAGQPITIVMSNLTATPEQLAYFQALDHNRQFEFWKRIRLELLRFRIAYTHLKLDGDGVSLSDQIVASRALTGVEFLSRVMFVRSAGRLYLELLAQEPPTIPTPSKAASRGQDAGIVPS